MNLKLLIILLVVLAGFAAVLIIGLAGDRAGDSRESPPWMEWFGAFVNKESVEPRDLIASCVEGRTFVVAPGRPCIITVRQARTTIRLLSVELVMGARARVRLTPKGSAGTPVDVPLRGASRRTPRLSVLEAGAELVLTCEVPAGVDPCRFALVSGAADD